MKGGLLFSFHFHRQCSPEFGKALSISNDLLGMSEESVLPQRFYLMWRPRAQCHQEKVFLPKSATDWAQTSPSCCLASSPSRDTFPELLIEVSPLSFLHRHVLDLRDMQINKAATRQEAKTRDESEALGTLKLANWPLRNWELATFWD